MHSEKNYQKGINMTKRILTMQDLSCVGQCSLTVALPLLSAFGVEACVLPTAILSNHTMFKTWSYLDLTSEIDNIYENWRQNDITFDGFLLGYLGKKSLMNLAEKAFADFSNDKAVKVIDPAFGDNGKLYGGFDEEYVIAMRHLLRCADIILPNLTEVCFMTGMPFKTEYDREYIERCALEMQKYTQATVIITGVELNGEIGELILKNGKISYVFAELLPKRLHGTGDIFAAVFTAKYLVGASLSESCKAAGEFVGRCIKATDDKHFYGANFEAVLADRD